MEISPTVAPRRTRHALTSTWRRLTEKFGTIMANTARLSGEAIPLSPV